MTINICEGQAAAVEVKLRRLRQRPVNLLLASTVTTVPGVSGAWLLNGVLEVYL